MKKIDAMQETYQLWWEFIIASDKYKKLCEGKFKLEAFGIHQYFYSFVPVRRRNRGIEVYPQKIPTVARKTTFTKWWKSQRQRLTRNNSEKGIREIDLEDFKRMRRFSSDFTNENYKDIGSVIVSISTCNKTIEDLQKELGELLKKRRDTSLFREYDFQKGYFELRKAYITPTKILSDNEIKALREYLKIYKLHKKLSWRKVYSMVDGRNNFDGKKNEFQRANRYCKRIFKNVENGIFPGCYR